MRTVLLGAAAFALAIVLICTAFIVYALLTRREVGYSASAFGLLTYYLLTTGGLSTLGFALTTALSQSWRNQKPGTTMILGAAMGVLSLFLQITGLATLLASPFLSVPGVRSMPLLSLLIVCCCTGFAAGAAALAISWLIRSLRQPAV